MRSKLFFIFIFLLAVSLIGSVAAADNVTGQDSQITDDIKVSYNDTVYEKDLGYIDVELPENTEGNLRATINNVEFYNENISSSVKVPISIPKGAISIIAVNKNTDHRFYHIDLFFNNTTILSAPLKVMMVAPNFTTPGFPSEILKEDPQGRVSIYFPESANGNVSLYIGGVFLREIPARQYLFLNATDFNTLALGNHNVTIVYSGDSYYRKFNKTFNFSVVDMLIQIPKNMLLDHDDCITAKILNNTDGIVTIYVDNKVVFKDKLDKYGEFLHSMFNDITCGEHLIEVQYNASNFSKSKKAMVNVTYTTDIWAYGHIYGEDSMIIITVPPDFNKKLITITIDGQIYKNFEIDYSGWIEIDTSKLPKGNHTLVYDFKGDEKYYNWSMTYDFAMDYEIVFPSFIFYGDKYIVSLTLPDSAKGYLEVYVEGKLYKKVKLADGIGSVEVSGFVPGEYKISARYTGNDFNVTDGEDIMTIYPDVTTPGEMFMGQDKYIVLKTLKKAKGKVIFSFNGNNVTVELKEGVAKLPLKDLGVGEYDMDVYYIGDNGFNCSLYSFVDVLNTRISISNVNVIYTDNAKVKVYVNGELAKNTQITFNIAGKTLKTKTDKNGVATLKVSTLKPGKYNLVALYKTGKTTKKLTVKHILSLKGVSVKKSAKKVTLKAKLSKKLKNKWVTFKFNGKTLKAKTNSNGIAKVTFIVSNLKAGKKITYGATYLKDNVKKTVTIKK